MITREAAIATAITSQRSRYELRSCILRMHMSSIMRGHDGEILPVDSSLMVPLPLIAEAHRLEAQHTEQNLTASERGSSLRTNVQTEPYRDSGFVP